MLQALQIKILCNILYTYRPTYVYKLLIIMFRYYDIIIDIMINA